MRKWSILKNFFNMKFWVGKDQNVIFPKFVIGGSGGLNKFSDSISGLVVKFLPVLPNKNFL